MRASGSVRLRVNAPTGCWTERGRRGQKEGKKGGRQERKEEGERKGKPGRSEEEGEEEVAVVCFLVD